MSDAYSVKVKIEADASGYAADLKKAQNQTTELGKTAGKTSGLVTRFGTELQVAGAVGVAALGALALSSVKAASDLEESANAVGKAFGPAADDIMELGENAAEMYGMSEQAFRQFSVRFSGFAKQIAGESGASVGDTMDEITTRVADFASVMNLDLTEASEVWSQTLAGETEAAKRFGLDVSDAAVKSYALANGIGEAGKELTNNEKVLARQGILMQQTAAYAGDFADTSDGLANQQRIMAAKFEDTKAALGQALLPVMTDAAGVAVSLLDAFNALPDGVQTSTLAVAALGAGLLIVIPRIAAFNASLVASNMTAKQFAMSMGKGGVYGALAAIAAVQLTTTISEIKGLSGAIDSLGDASSTDEAREKIKALRAEIDSTTDVSIFELASAAGMLDSVWAKVSGTLGDAESQIVATEAQISAFDAMIRSIASETGASEEALLGAAESMGLFGEGAGYAGDQLRGWVAEQANGKTAAGQLAGATETLGDVTATAADQTQAYEDALKSLNDTVLGITDAEIAFESGLDDLTDSVKENGASLDISTDAGRANASTLTDLARNARDAAQAELDHATATGDSENATARANGVYASHMRRLEEVFVALGLNRDQVRRLIGDYDRVPDLVTTKVTADTEGARAAVNRFITDTNGRVFTLKGNVRLPSSPGAQGLATGGMVRGPGGPTSDAVPLWGSNGEYMIRASSVDKYGVRFFDAVNAGRFASGGLVGGRPVAAGAGVGGGVTVYLSVGGSVTSERDLARTVADELRRRTARGDAA